MVACRERVMTMVPASTNAVAVASPMPEFARVAEVTWHLNNYDQAALLLVPPHACLMDFRKRMICYVARLNAARYFWEGRRLPVAMTVGAAVLDQCCGTMMRQLKQLRLQEAWHLMLSQNFDAGSVDVRVGYESASQFSREYARLFGAPTSAWYSANAPCTLSQRDVSVFGMHTVGRVSKFAHKAVCPLKVYCCR
jgi:hypothetical protein